MTDNGDGTYTVDYTVPSEGTFSVSVILAELQSGLQAEYFITPAWNGAPALTRIDPNIYFDWGNSWPASGADDYVSARWSGTLIPPYSETYTFSFQCDDYAEFYIDGTLRKQVYWSAWHTYTISLIAGQKYLIELKMQEYGIGALIYMKWSSASISN